MDTYVILRRSGWRSGRSWRGGGPLDGGGRADGGRHPLDPELRARGGRTASARSASTRRRVRRRSAPTPPPPICPVDEIVRVADTVIVRPDPLPAAAASRRRDASHPDHCAVRRSRCSSRPDSRSPAARSTAPSPPPPASTTSRRRGGGLQRPWSPTRRESRASPSRAKARWVSTCSTRAPVRGRHDRRGQAGAARLRAAEQRHAEARRARVPRLQVGVRARQAVALRPGVRRDQGREPLRIPESWALHAWIWKPNPSGML